MLPPALTLKRFAAPFFVFILGISIPLIMNYESRCFRFEKLIKPGYHLCLTANENFRDSTTSHFNATVSFFESVLSRFSDPVILLSFFLGAKTITN